MTVSNEIKEVLTRCLMIIILGAMMIIAWQFIGFLGLAVLGLLVGVIAFGTEQAMDLYRQDMGTESMSAAERAARHAEIESAVVPLRAAKIVSAGLIVGGLGLFFLVQLGA